ncbi:MAG: 4-alpha-glucanotransferase, partial [Actinomycetota bacterium]
AGPPPASAIVVRSDERPDLSEITTVRLEQGGEARPEELPPELPLGYHSIVGADGRKRALIVSPGACFTPPDLHVWGWGTQLYALHSSESWGIGDLGDLRSLARWARSTGAGALLLNPLHAAQPGPHQQASPYTPTSRRWRNPLYVRVEDVPGAERLEDLDEIVRAGRALNESELIDRDAVYECKLGALERVWRARPPMDEFERWSAHQGGVLEDFATFVSLAEQFGPASAQWPGEYSHPRGPAVAQWRAGHADRIRFHEWVQWLLESQLAQAADEIGLIHDLAIGVDRQGADAWIWGDVFAPGMKVGAPPDEFNSLGQDWGLPPFDPWKLRTTDYEAFVETIRSNLRVGAGLRIDHVMGLFRLFWIPDDAGPAEGTYVRYPHKELLDIVALESHRATSLVVGEDLGTVEPFVREEMIVRNMLSYRIMWFEESMPADYPENATAAIGNHDLQTVAGLWTGSDLAEQIGLNIAPNVEATHALRERLRERLGVTEESSIDEVMMRAHEHLAQAPSRILVATLEDACAQVPRTNQPGTTGDHRPNWSLRLPLSLEELGTHPRPAAIARTLSR